MRDALGQSDQEVREETLEVPARASLHLGRDSMRVSAELGDEFLENCGEELDHLKGRGGSLAEGAHPVENWQDDSGQVQVQLVLRELSQQS
jgi:hypothetical protein